MAATDPSADRSLPPTAAVRRSTAADVDAFLAVQAEVAGEGRWIGRELPLDTEARRAAFLAGIDDPERLSLVATVDGRVVGSLGMEHDGMGHAGLGMFLAAEARGRRLGSALLAEAISWADVHPVIHKVELQVWPHNTAALALYRAQGFLVEGHLHRHWRRRNGELWDSVVMGLAVTDRT